MSDGKSIDDLEVTVRTAAFLQDLGVRTVEELISLPEIHPPNRLVAAELQAMFGDLDLVFSGRMVVHTPEVIAATGDLTERWRTITAWLEQHHPRVLEKLHPPATAHAISAAEQSVGRVLPEDYKQFLRQHNGQDYGAPMVGTCSLFAVESLADAYESLHELFESEGSVDEDLVGEGVRPVECSAGWIPIGRSARGRDFLCIDLDPAVEGRSGQIIQVSVDFDDRPRIATSFTELLSVFFEQMQAGGIDGEDDDDPA